MRSVSYLLVGIAEFVLEDGFAVGQSLQLAGDGVEGFNQLPDQLGRVHDHGSQQLDIERPSWRTLVLEACAGGPWREGDGKRTDELSCGVFIIRWLECEVLGI